MENKMNEDSLYIERFLSGENSAFEALVRKYQNRVLNIVYSLIGKDRESEDIVQDVFLKVYHGLESFNGRSRFSTWLYRITVNTTYDFLRRRRRFISDELTIEKTASGYGGPQEELLEKEKQELLKKALGNVPLKYRAALVLRDIEGLDYATIAQVLHCRLGTVESRIYRGRQILKQELFRWRGETL